VFAALDQRIATRYQLAPMDLAEAAQFLRHHLALVGRTDPLIADDTIGQPGIATRSTTPLLRR
jgi:type II secretory pathway predicted ATPase ExeA